MSLDMSLWYANACGPRSLIEAVKHYDNSWVITPQEIFDRFASESYGVWNIRPGATDTILLCRIIRELPIARFAVSHVDHEQLIDLKPKAFACLGFTDLFPDEKTGALVHDNHVMVIWPDHNGCSFASPRKKDSGFDRGLIPWDKWREWKMHGMLLCGDARSTPLHGY